MRSGSSSSGMVVPVFDGIRVKYRDWAVPMRLLLKREGLWDLVGEDLDDNEFEGQQRKRRDEYVTIETAAKAEYMPAHERHLIQEAEEERDVVAPRRQRRADEQQEEEDRQHRRMIRDLKEKKERIDRANKTISHVFERKYQQQLERDGAKATALLIQYLFGLPRSMAMDKKMEENPRKIWQQLRSTYERRGEDHIVKLQQQLFTRGWEKGERVSDVMSDYIEWYNELVSAGGVIQEKTVLLHVLQQLPPQFRHIKPVFLYSTGVTLQNLLEALLGEEESIHQQQQEAPSHRIAAAREARECWYCGAKGHVKANCRKKQRDEQRGNKNDGRERDRSHYSRGRGRGKPYRGGNKRGRGGGSSAKAFSVRVYTAVNECTKGKWVVDSGATSHVTSFRKDFCEMTKTETNIVLADGSTVTAKGKGTVKLQTKAGRIELQDVLWIPEGQTRIISVHKMVKSNRLTLEGDEAKVMFADGSQLSLTAKDSLYYLEAEQREEKEQATTAQERVNDNNHSNSVFQAEPTEAVQLMKGEFKENPRRILEGFHELMGHRGGTCPTCIKSKMKKKRVRKKSKTETKIRAGDKMSIDISGPHPPALTGEKYALILRDVASGLVAAEGMASKAEVPATLRRILLALPKKMDIGKRVCTIKSDQEPVMQSQQMAQLLHEFRLDQTFSSPHTPQRNGHAERTIGTLTTMARSMLFDAKLPVDFWLLAIQHAATVTNYLGAFQSMGLHPPVDDLRRFGVTCFVQQQGRKWDERARQGVYVGYDCSSRSHMVYMPDTNRTIKTYNMTALTMAESHLRAVAPIADSADVGPHSTTAPMLTGIGKTTTSKGTRRFKWYEQQTTKENGREGEKANKTTTAAQATAEHATATQATAEHATAEHATAEHATAEHATAAQASTTKSNIPEGFEEAHQKEMSSLHRHGVLQEVKQCKGQVLDCKWLFVTKADGRKKARCVVRGDRIKQEQETYSPTAARTVVLTALAAARGRNVVCADVRTAFLHAPIPEGQNIYVRISGKIYKLKKALYGLPTAPRLFYSYLRQILVEAGWTPSIHDPCLFTRHGSMIVAYVDDLLIIADDAQAVMRELQQHMDIEQEHTQKKFTYLGLDVEMKDGVVRVSSDAYTDQIKSKFNIGRQAPTTPVTTDYHKKQQQQQEQQEKQHQEQRQQKHTDRDSQKLFQEKVGTLLYLASTARPDLATAASYLGEAMQQATEEDMRQADRALAFATARRGALQTRKGDRQMRLDVFTDASFATEKQCKSRTGYLLLIDGMPVAWTSKRQSVVATSSCEAELLAITQAMKTATFVRGVLEEMGYKQATTTIYTDSQPSINVATKEEGLSTRTRHLAVPIHFVKQKVKAGEFKMQYIPTGRQIADTMTKALPRTQLKKLVDQFMVE